MTEFRTKGIGKNRQVFPVGGGKEYRRQYDYQPPKESEDKTSYKESEVEYEASVKEEEAQKEEEEREKKRKEQELRKAENPSYYTKSIVKSDIKKLERADDSKINKEKNFQKYKTRLDRTMDITHAKEDERVDRRREKAISKVERLEEKSEKIKQEIGE